MRRRPESPVAIGVIVGAIALVFVTLRLLVAADGDISRFVVAGSAFTDAAQVQPAIRVIDGSAGYDGQFYWRLATNPTELNVAANHGVRFDAEFRATRIGYPAIAWTLSLGQASWVKWSLVVSNILGMAAIAWSGARIARSRGRRPLVGLALASSSGLVFSISRDLCEVTMVAGLTAGVALMARRQYAWASLCWMVACLAHEQALLCVIPFGAYRLVEMIRRRERLPAAQDLPWIASLATFGLWQLICLAVIGKVSVLTSKSNVGIPFKGLFEQSKDWLLNGIGPVEAIIVPQVALLVTLVVLAFRSVKNLQADDRWLSWVLVVAALLTASLSNYVWDGPADLRHFVVLSTIAWLVIVKSGTRIPIALIAATGTVWMLTAAARIAEV